MFKIHSLSFFFILLIASNPLKAEYSREFIDSYAFSTAQHDKVNIAYKVIGEAELPTVIFIMGLGATHALWGDNFVEGISNAGYRVVLIDNRDTGQSSKFDHWGEPTLWWQFLKNYFGLKVNKPYVLRDMAGDVIAVMDDINIDKAHILGASMGGMIAQILSAEYPERVMSLTSIMSTTGAPHLPPPSPESREMLNNFADGEAEEDQTATMLAMGFQTSAVPRQLMAILSTGDRSPEVAKISVPTLVLHGADDGLIPQAHGQHTAELIEGSKFIIYPGMGHNLPEAVLPQLLKDIAEHLIKNS